MLPGNAKTAPDQPVSVAAAQSSSASSPSSSSRHRSLDELLLFYPSKYPEGDWKPADLVFEDVWFPSPDGTRLHGWYCPCPNARAVLLYAHGNGGNLSQYASLMRYFQKDLRLTTLIFDYRGYGRSEGVPTVAGVLQDARAARALLARRAGVREEDVVLMGRSLGGAVAVQLAAQKRPRGLILESTFSSLREVAAIHYPRLAWIIPVDKLDSLSLIKRYDGPLLQSHGDADRTIPYALGRKLFEAARGPKVFVPVPGGDHNDPQPLEYYRRLDEFLAGLPPRRPSE
jgi:fermentation-respiration switch protein FrsA (DUF1100 family)